jgi:hypothetical protein
LRRGAWRARSRLFEYRDVFRITVNGSNAHLLRFAAIRFISVDDNHILAALDEDVRQSPTDLASANYQ